MCKTIIVIVLTFLLCVGLAACAPNNDSQESMTSTPIQSEQIDTDNKLSDETKSILYENLNIGFSMLTPSSWEGKYSVKELDQTYGDGGTIKSISLFHNATMDELGSDVGWLFSINRVTGEDFTEDEPPIMSGQTIILSQTGGYTYFIHFPSGVEYNEDPESESAVEYKEIVGQVDLLINTFKVIEKPTELDNGENPSDITNIASLTLDEIGENDDAVQLILHIPEGERYAELVEVVVTLGDGRLLTKSYEGFFASRIYTADLLDNGWQELVINLSNRGSNYGAADVHVLGVIDGELTEILTILNNPSAILLEADKLEADKYKQTMFEIPQPEDNFGLGENGRADICTGVSVIDFGGKSALKIRHLMKDAIPYTILMWNGLEWTVAKQGIDRYESSIPQEDFTGEWHRTNTVKALSGAITIKNQAEESFDFSFFGIYGANSGTITGTAVIIAGNKAVFNHTPEYDKTTFAQVTFTLEGDSLQINLTDGYESALGFGHNVSIDGAYTKSEPIYLDEVIIDEILPTNEIKEKMQGLLGKDVYEQVLYVVEHSVRFLVDDLTYSGFVSGAGQGVDLLIKDDKVYCLGYGLDADGFVYKLYTNDKDYQDKLPPFMQIDRPNYVLQFVYKPL